MQINYLEVIFRSYNADCIFAVSMATQLTLCQSHLKKILFNWYVKLWLVFHKLRGRQLLIRLEFKGSFPQRYAAAL